MSATAATALLLTLQVAALATALVFVPATLLAYALARSRFRGKSVVTSLLVLPMVLPPTAVGYLLLLLLSDDGLLGIDTLGFDPGILLTRRAAVLAASVMAFPLVIRTAQAAFESVDPRLESMARTLGHGRASTFARFTLPLASRGLLAAAIFGFARSIGEFGATIMIAGNIPGRTQTLALAIFSAQQVGDDRGAFVLLGVALVTGFVALLTAERLVRGAPR